MSQSSSYFSPFQHFVPNSSAPLTEEFARLALNQDWKPKSKKYVRERGCCFLAEYKHHFGQPDSFSKLAAWQDLCSEVGIRKAPSSITQCKKVLHSVHINLVDLIDSRRNCTKVPTFENAAALRKYTVSQGKVFPKKTAKQNGLVKIFLRQMY